MNIESIESRVLYEDNHLIIINKNVSEIVQADKTEDPSLEELVKQYLKIKYNKPFDVFLGVIHRLDRPVSGIVIFAKTSKALVRMNELFKERKIIKVYWALVKNKPKVEAESLTHYLKRNEKLNKTFVSETPKKDYQEARLSYKFINSSTHLHCLEIKLHTGRHHQIRAQLSYIGSPIRGDVKYGDKRSNDDSSINLHARKIEFIHPVSKINLEITAPVPSSNAWKFVNS
jgi:23S rRNA pseudouridine1911/1915/1917 synthase